MPAGALWDRLLILLPAYAQLRTQSRRSGLGVSTVEQSLAVKLRSLISELRVCCKESVYDLNNIEGYMPYEGVSPGYTKSD